MHTFNTFNTFNAYTYSRDPPPPPPPPPTCFQKLSSMSRTTSCQSTHSAARPPPYTLTWAKRVASSYTRLPRGAALARPCVVEVDAASAQHARHRVGKRHCTHEGSSMRELNSTASNLIYRCAWYSVMLLVIDGISYCHASRAMYYYDTGVLGQCKYTDHSVQYTQVVVE